MKKLILNSFMLRDSIKIVSKGLVKSPVIPIIGHYHCSVKSGEMTIRATDLETELSVTVSVESDTDFDFILDSSILKMLDKLENQPLTFDLTGSELKIEAYASKDKFSFCNDDPNDFPRTRDGEFIPVARIEQAQAFLNELKNQIPYHGKDELRLNLCGTNFETTETGVNLNSTDANRLRTMAFKMPVFDQVDTIIVPHACSILTTLKASVIKVSKLATEHGWPPMKFECDNVVLITKGRDERFPQYRAVIPEKCTTTVTLSKAALTKLIAKAALFANTYTNHVQFAFTKACNDFGTLTVKSHNYDLTKEYEGIMDCKMTGEPIETGFNFKYLDATLKSLPETVTIEMNTPSRAAIFRDGNALNLLMPVMLSEDF